MAVESVLIYTEWKGENLNLIVKSTDTEMEIKNNI